MPSGLPVIDGVQEPTAFVHVTEAAGIDAKHTKGYQITGQAWADYDGDGWLDLYVTDSVGPNTLYRNNGDGTFSVSPLNEQVALPEHYSGGVAGPTTTTTAGPTCWCWAARPMCCSITTAGRASTM